MKIKAGIILICTFIIIFVLMYSINKWESNQIIKNTDNKVDNRGIVQVFFTKRSVIPLAVGVLMSLRLRDLITSMVNTIVFPIFELDLDKNGQPDIREITDLLTLNIFGLKYKFGLFLLDFIKFILFVCIVYILIIVLYTKTNYIKL